MAKAGAGTAWLSASVLLVLIVRPGVTELCSGVSGKGAWMEVASARVSG